MTNIQESTNRFGDQVWFVTLGVNYQVICLTEAEALEVARTGRPRPAEILVSFRPY